MALFACPECRRLVSTRAETCPQCSCPLDSVLDPVVEEAGTHPEPVLAFSGRWIGEKGDQWDLHSELEVLGSLVRGRIRWTLVECPPSLPYAQRIGHSGYEFVEGSLE